MRASRLAVAALLVAFLAPTIGLPAVAQQARLSTPTRVINETAQKGFPSSRLYWDVAQMTDLASSPIRVRVAPPTRFTSLAIAWTVNGGNPPASLFRFSISSRTVPGSWCSPVSMVGETAPSENPSGLYWSSLYMTPGGSSNDEVEVVMTFPPGVQLTMLQVMAAELLPLPGSRRVLPKVATPYTGREAAPRPTIIPRQDWWGDLPPDSLDGHFGPILITISHAVVHHTAMTNNPPDPSQEIRSIWNLHVYGNGWSDIGYNFLIDQFGNIYQGRYNPWLDSTDVQGAHATSANVKSVGISVLGNFSAFAGGIPDPRALGSLERLIAWRFDQRGLNAFDSASIPTNLGGPRVVARICGHRDVGVTECPGESLYVLLPTVRTNVHALLTSIAVNEPGEPLGFKLLQNYPNPFNPTTVVSYQVSGVSYVRLVVFDLLGREAAVLVNEKKAPGRYEVEFDGSGLASGVYFYRLRVGDPSTGPGRSFVQTRKLLLLR